MMYRNNHMTLKPFIMSVVFLLTMTSTALYAAQKKEDIIYPEVMEFIVSEIYQVSSHRPKQVRIEVYNLDDKQNIADEFTKKLQALPKEKRMEFIEKMKTEKGTGTEFDIVSRLQSVAKGRYLSSKYGLTHFPAVIFNEGESVVYGITDVEQAIKMYSDWVKQQ